MDLFDTMKASLKEMLLSKGVAVDDAERMEQQIEERIRTEEEPKIAFVGFAGVGKSSTLNALFNAGQPTSAVRACTMEAKRFLGDAEKYTGTKGSIYIYDMPGLGDSIENDKRNYGIYERILPEVDVIVWTFHAGDRAMAPMQQALIELKERIGSDFTRRLMFAINKADAMAPGETDWDERVNVPSREQQENLSEFTGYVLERIHEVLPAWDGPVIVYSAKRRYHLEQLMTAMVETMPKRRRWRLNQVADVADYFEMIDPAYQEYIHSLMKNESTPLGRDEGIK